MSKETSTEPSRVSAPKSSGRKFKVHRVEVERADNGGYISTHHFKQDGGRPHEMGSYKEAERHVHKSAKDMQADVAKSFGEKAASGQEADEELPADE